MFTLNLLFSRSYSSSTKIRTVFLAVKNLQKNFFKSKHTTSYNINYNKSHVKSDVVLFEYENPKYFLYMNVASGIQCAFWTYLGFFLLKTIKNLKFEVDKKDLMSIILEKERNHSGHLSGLALFFGWSMFVTTCFYSVRSVRKLILNDRKNLTIVTYSIPGYNIIKVPLSSVSSNLHRIKAKKFIPMKIKNKYFYYLLDVRGEFSNPELFDRTVGVKRSF